jgi:hypothetical protein
MAISANLSSIIGAANASPKATRQSKTAILEQKFNSKFDQLLALMTNNQNPTATIPAPVATVVTAPTPAATVRRIATPAPGKVITVQTTPKAQTKAAAPKAAAPKAAAPKAETKEWVPTPFAMQVGQGQNKGFMLSVPDGWVPPGETQAISEANPPKEGHLIPVLKQAYLFQGQVVEAETRYYLAMGEWKRNPAQNAQGKAVKPGWRVFRVTRYDVDGEGNATKHVNAKAE